MPRLEVQPAFPRFVLGGPLVVVLTLTTSRPGVILYRLPKPSLVAPVGLGARVTRDGATTTRPAVPLDPMRHSKLTLGATPRRLLVEVSELVGADPGRCMVELLFATPFGAARSNPIEIAAHAPTDRERAALDAVRSELRADESFGEWLRRTGPSALDDVAAADLGQLALHRFVRRFRDARGRVDESALDALPPALSPERAAFVVERAALAGEAFEEAANAVRALGVGLDGWMDDLEQGHSWTGAFRRAAPGD